MMLENKLIKRIAALHQGDDALSKDIRNVCRMAQRLHTPLPDARLDEATLATLEKTSYVCVTGELLEKMIAYVRWCNRVTRGL